MVRERRLLQLILSVLAMGAGLGLSLGTTADTKVKTVDEYWTDSGFGPGAVAGVVEDKFCRASQRAFLSCVNAVISVAGQMQLSVDVSGALSASASSEGAASERSSLEPWKIFFRESPEKAKQISFKKTWNDLVSRMPADRVSSFSALAYNSYLSVYRDPHTYMIPVNYYKQVIASSSVAPFSMGFVMARGENEYFLRKVMAASPAEKAGLKRGDLVLAVNGQKLAALPQHLVGDLLRPKGPTTEFRILRDGRESTLRVARIADSIPNVSFKTLAQPGNPKHSALLTINKFARGTCEEVKTELKKIVAEGFDFLLLDLRDNSGGHMNEASCIVGLFVGPGKVAYTTKFLNPGRPGEVEYTSEMRLWKERMAVLVNSGSASASEIVAGALRDHKRALLVGERTFGKGSFQEGEEWYVNGNVALFETKGFYFLPSGYSPQMRGLLPDLEIGDATAFHSREEDQYAYPLRGPGPAHSAMPTTLTSSCPELDEALEDEQITGAARALHCQKTLVGGLRASN